MLLDAQSLFSDGQEITSGVINSTNVVRFGAGDVSFVPVLIQAVEDFTNLTSLNVKIQTSSDEGFSQAVDLIDSTMKLEELKTGARFPICHLPKGNLGYLRLVYTVDGSAETTGKITAGVVIGNGLSFHEV